MRRFGVLAVAACAIAIPAGNAGAAEIPPIHCDPVACTEPVDRLLERTEGAQDCVEGAVRAVRYILQGTPQPQECSP